MYRIFDKIIFERNLIFSIDLHEGSWISCFRAWYNRTLTTSSSQPLFVCVSVSCYCRALNQIGLKAKQAPFSWIYNCTTFRNISTVSLYTCTCMYCSTPGKTLLSCYCHISESMWSATNLQMSSWFFIVICLVFVELMINMNLVLLFLWLSALMRCLSLPTFDLKILVRYFCNMYETTNVPKPVHFLHRNIYSNAWIDLYCKTLLKEIS